MLFKAFDLPQWFHVFLLFVAVSSSTYRSSRKKTCRQLDSMVHAGNTRAVDTSTRAVACPCAGVPQSRLFEYIHHSDNQGTVKPSRKTKTKRRPSCHCLGAWARHTEQRHTGQRARETVDTCKTKAQILAQGTTQRAIHRKKNSVIKKSRERIYLHYGLNFSLKKNHPHQNTNITDLINSKTIKSAPRISVIISARMVIHHHLGYRVSSS